MRLLIIRHAQSTNNTLPDLHGADVPQRVEDPEITELGLMQAHRLGELLASLPEPGTECPWQVAWRPEVLYTSLMSRAAHTSSILAEHTGAKLAGWEDIHEVGGIYLDDPVTGGKRGLPGATRPAFARRFPRLELPESVGPQGWWNRPFETEPGPPIARATVVARRLHALSELPENAERTVGIVTHGGFYGYLLPKVLRIPGREWLAASMSNTGCTLVRIEPEEARLVFHNNLRHLPFEMIT